MKIDDVYKNLGINITGILEETLGKDLTLLSSNHSFLNDFDSWLKILEKRPEASILKNSIKEFQLAILCSCLGMYQQAFTGLRFFLERTLVAILFSANEIELNLWKLGERDTYWSEIMDDDKGVFAKKFSKAFFIELDVERSHFKAITQKVYRECSEFVHGNSSVIEKIPETLIYSEELFNEWQEKADIIKRIILFTFCLRYLKTLTKDEIEVVENSLAEEFKSSAPIISIITK